MFIVNAQARRMKRGARPLPAVSFPSISENFFTLMSAEQHEALAFAIMTAKIL